MRTRAVRLSKTGVPEVMGVETIEIPGPAPGEVLIEQAAIGFNFIDVYHRMGRYPLPLPSGLGVEAAGVVLDTGAGVAHLRPGDRVIYKMQLGAYAEHRTISASELVRTPDGLSFDTAVAAFTKGLTAEFLLRRLHCVKPGEVLLVHAAAGGVGGFLTQWARHLGATVIGVVGSQAKAEIAAGQGCDHVLQAGGGLAATVRALTGGRGVDVVYDSIGRDTFQESLDCLRPHGLFVSYGSASGLIEPFDFNGLGGKGAPFLTRASISSYYSTRAELEAGADLVFDLLARDVVRPRIARTYDFDDIHACHRDAEARRHAGSVIIRPETAAAAQSGA